MANFREEALRQLANVIAVIAVLGERDALAHELLRACSHRDREVLDLLAGVVVVELARDRVALRLEQRRNRIAEGRLPSMAEVKRPGRVRRDEFDHDALAFVRE